MKATYTTENATHKIDIDLFLEYVEKEKLDWNLNLIKGYWKFSASGEVWENGKEESFGQVLNNIAELFPNDKTIARIVRLWEKYHLNDMKAGTKAQTAKVNTFEKKDYDYCLKNLGDLVEDNGYKYGSAWLVQPIPQGALLKITNLIEKLDAELVED